MLRSIVLVILAQLLCALSLTAGTVSVETFTANSGTTVSLDGALDYAIWGTGTAPSLVAAYSGTGSAIRRTISVVSSGGSTLSALGPLSVGNAYLTPEGPVYGGLKSLSDSPDSEDGFLATLYPTLGYSSYFDVYGTSFGGPVSLSFPGSDTQEIQPDHNFVARYLVTGTSPSRIRVLVLSGASAGGSPSGVAVSAIVARPVPIVPEPGALQALLVTLVATAIVMWLVRRITPEQEGTP
jgi:hypothetical protein